MQNIIKSILPAFLAIYGYKKIYLEPHGNFMNIFRYYITKLLFKHRWLEWINRAKANLTTLPLIKFFPSISDPHTYVLLQSLQSTCSQYECTFQIYSVSPRRAIQENNKHSSDGLSTFERFQKAAQDRKGDNTHQESNKYYQQPTEWNIADGHTASADMQYEWSIQDAKLSAQVHCLKAFVPPTKSVRPKLELLADLALLQTVQSFGRGMNPVLTCIEMIAFCEKSVSIADLLSKGNENALLSMNTSSTSNGNVITNKQATAAFNSNHTHLTTLGHYLPGMLYLPSEFYWSTDRLNYLEERLYNNGNIQKNQISIASNKNTNNVDNGFKKWRNQYNMNCKKDIIYTHIYTNLSPLISGHAMVSDNSTNVRNVLEMWYSPRSPYSQLAIARFYAIARYYQVPCVVNVVLPMVMRPDPLAVPRTKSMYIIMDTSRESYRVGFPGLAMADPVGPGVLRFFAIWNSLIKPFKNSNLEEKFLRSFSKGVWSEGFDFATDSGAKVVCQRAGLNWHECYNVMKVNNFTGDADLWKTEEMHQRNRMDQRGLWGVPSFAYGETSAWGQDRLKALEMAVESDLIGNNTVNSSMQQPVTCKM